MIFSPEEAVAIYLGTAFLEQVWGSLYQTAARGAMAKLDNVLPEEQRREVDWARRTLQATGITLSGSIVYGKQLEILWTAVHDRRRVRMRYRSWNQPEALQRDIDPYVLWHGWGWQYCVGYCHMRQDLRTFRLDRILEANLLEQTFSIPADFDLEAHLNANQFFQQRFEIRLHFTPEAAVQALDNLGQWDTLEEQPDGSLIAAFTIPNLEIAASIVMTYGYRATVMEPEELRALVRERASALAARNNKENKYDN
jgi:predicted DNA-binding transcriptional regulator YafY